MQTKKALVFGATGLVGGYVLDLLLMDPRYDKVTAFSRRSLHKNHQKLESIITDFSDSHYESNLMGDDIFCCLGTTLKVAGSKEAFQAVDLELPLHIAEIGKKNGIIQYLVVSAMGANPKSVVFYNRIKGEMEKGILDKNFSSTVILRPSMLLGPRYQTRRMEEISKFLMRALGFVFVGKLRRFKAIHAKDVAIAMVELANKKVEKSIYRSDEIYRIAQTV